MVDLPAWVKVWIKDVKKRMDKIRSRTVGWNLDLSICMVTKGSMGEILYLKVMDAGIGGGGIDGGVRWDVMLSLVQGTGNGRGMERPRSTRRKEMGKWDGRG